MPLEDLIQDLDSTVSLLTYCLGAVFGNRIALADKRKEFNEAASPVRAYLLAEINQFGAGGHSPTGMEMDLFVNKLPWLKRKRFLKAYKEQREVRGNNFRQDPKTGECFYETTEGIIKALEKCLAYTDLK